MFEYLVKASEKRTIAFLAVLGKEVNGFRFSPLGRVLSLKYYLSGLWAD